MGGGVAVGSDLDAGTSIGSYLDAGTAVVSDLDASAAIGSDLQVQLLALTQTRNKACILVDAHAQPENQERNSYSCLSS